MLFGFLLLVWFHGGSLAAILADVAQDERCAASSTTGCEMVTVDEEHLLLLQRGAQGKNGLSLEMFGGKAAPRERKVRIGFYNDSECTFTGGAEVVASAETDFCSMDWNFTCGCSRDDKIIIATRYENCGSKRVISSESMPVGECTAASRAGSDGLYMVLNDMGTCPSCGTTCAVYGDPHIGTFDKAEIALFPTHHRDHSQHKDSKLDADAGTVWLVKSDLVRIQARYGQGGQDRGATANHTFTSLAVGGAFLDGNALVVDTSSVRWVNVEGSPRTILENPGIFSVGGLLKAHRRQLAHVSKDPQAEEQGAFLFHLPFGVRLEVNAFLRHLEVSITMPAEAGGHRGVDGLCGNFNGHASDDKTKLILKRMGGKVKEEESLFLEPLEITLEANAFEAQQPLQAELVSSGAVTAYYYNDENCEDRANYHDSFSVGTEHCELGWNFTCNCVDDVKVVVVTRNSPGCSAPAAAVATMTIPANQCIAPGKYNNIVLNRYFRIDATACSSCVSEGQACTIHGDPHITVFDDQEQVVFLSLQQGPVDKHFDDMYGWGDFWLVKSLEVHIQARYRKVFYPKATEAFNQTYLTAIAIGGPFLGGHKCIVEPKDGRVLWTFDGGDTYQILEHLGSDFVIDGIVTAESHERSGIVPRTFGLTRGVDFKLPSGVQVRVDRFSKHIDAQIRMTRAAGGGGGFDGQCGNFNGDASDDTAELIDERIGYQVSDSERLFEDGGLEGIEK
mmetsp:Transcript_13383/g.31407  ORF Transcript_13383/g.31407 Transcript_13383/m.31407 type:complete len:733 (-) Transcript_13383:118-2316(-)